VVTISSKIHRQRTDRAMKTKEMEMREIKFRAWDMNNNLWVGGYFYDEKNDEHEIHVEVGVVPIVEGETIGQFTGLHDKNGVEIYEGDIVQWASAAEWDPVASVSPIADVRFHDGCFCVGTCYGGNLTNIFSVKIIGNIHENPGLLEKVDD